ncbi:unnamed protein product [Mytilus coruscus]|uniref:PHD-type domain-containing protein n=1 Tax=Mytilus coruscus TaxID=42192 RepID=A0A6J8C103_MYTCO|nr:unnamed protein product [Mytilus coruscus]
MKKHKNLSLRKSHPLEKCRAEISLNQIDQYYDLLESTLKRLDLMNDPTRINNCDESGFSGHLNGTKKVIVPKHIRHPYQTQVNISGHITLLLAISAAGQTPPPLVIFSGALPRDDYSTGIPDSWLFEKTESGFVNSDLYMNWFNNAFLPSIGRKRPVLLIHDNHVTHLSTYAIDAARDNGVDLLFFPSHSSHLLQPLDVVYFHALKQKVADMSVELGYFGIKTLPRKFFPKILMQSMNRLTGLTVSSSFLATGIYSFNKKAVHALEFNPSSCASQSRAVNDGDDPEERQACDSCGHSKDNILVKMGLVSTDLANILVEPPISKQIGNKKQSKRKTLNTARVYPSISATNVTSYNTDETTVPSNDEAQPGSSGTNIIQKTVTKQVTKRKSKECTTTTRKKKAKKSMKKSKAIIDDDNVLCITCMTNNQQFYWVGCDRCDNWVHYECLPARVQTDVDLSLITDEPWYCNVCVQSEE